MKKMKRIQYILLSCLLLCCFASCEVDFSPNDEWKEMPVVYCVLDQDDDTTFVRVQKCYLGSGNQYDYAAIYDSINYRQGDIQVKILGWPSQRSAGNVLSIAPWAAAPTKDWECSYMEVDKEDGSFNATKQPIYFFPTKNLFDTNLVYQLLVINTRSGDTIARATTSLLGNPNTTREFITKPSNNSKFQFQGNTGMCELQWFTLPRARKYQPVIRFYYKDFILTPNGHGNDTTIIRHSIDIEYGTKSPAINEVTQCNRSIDEQTYLSVLRTCLQDDTVHKIIIDTVDIYLRCCNEELSNYIYSHETSTSINQNRVNYTNIEGGVGVFASRRTHMYVRRITPPNGDSDYKKKIHKLGVNLW